MTKISLSPTAFIHGRLNRANSEGSIDHAALVDLARDRVRSQGMVFEADRELSVALSPLLLQSEDFEAIRQLTESLHGIVEQALDWLVDDSARLARFFGDHQRVWPYLRRTKGSPTWQTIARYDAIVAPDGQIKIIELNTACPAGFVHSSGMAAITRTLLNEISPEIGQCIHGSGAIGVNALSQGLLGVEAEGGFEPGLIALVNDENNLFNELELLKQQFVSYGRDVAIVPATEISYRNGKAYWGDRELSLTFNKVRVSTAHSPNHKWTDGFEDRYRGFLECSQHDAMASVNCMMGLSIAEDKALLGVLHHPGFLATLNAAQVKLVLDHVLPTARLVDEPVHWKGHETNPLEMARQGRQNYVVKPANEGRGFGLCVGKHATPDEWAQACQIDSVLPKVIQAHAEPAQIPVCRLGQESMEVEPMYLTLGMAMIRGKFEGLLSRISSNPVTNISRSGMVQAVYLTDEQDLGD